MRHFEENEFIFRYEMKSGVCYFSLIVAETKDASFKPILSCFKLILINIITATISDLKVLADIKLMYEYNCCIFVLKDYLM